jgi:hypothetical protein
MEVLILKTKSGDWESMYIDGKMVADGHELGEGNNFYFLLEMSEKYGFKRKDIRESELNDYDDEYTSDIGCMPKELSSLTGKY